MGGVDGPDPDDYYMEEAQAAAFLKIKVDTLRKWRNGKAGPPYRKIGRRVVYVISEVIEWLKNTKK